MSSTGSGAGAVDGVESAGPPIGMGEGPGPRPGIGISGRAEARAALRCFGRPDPLPGMGVSAASAAASTMEVAGSADPLPSMGRLGGSSATTSVASAFAVVGALPAAFGDTFLAPAEPALVPAALFTPGAPLAPDLGTAAGRLPRRCGRFTVAGGGPESACEAS
ncbi:MAG: hypothetical protein ABSH30_09095 [Acidimicrobiales bacterium]